jgi:hypothetical protein
MIRYYNGNIDARHTITTNVDGSSVYALQVNIDGSYDWIQFDDLEYDKSVRIADCTIDATAQDIEAYEAYRRKELIGRSGHIAHIGNIVKVVKGRKYPIGLEATVLDTYEYIVPNTYGHKKTWYLITDKGRIDGLNCLIIG